MEEALGTMDCVLQVVNCDYGWGATTQINWPLTDCQATATR